MIYCFGAAREKPTLKGLATRLLLSRKTTTEPKT